jgi:hypothetical protein
VSLAPTRLRRAYGGLLEDEIPLPRPEAQRKTEIWSNAGNRYEQRFASRKSSECIPVTPASCAISDLLAAPRTN